MLTMHATGNLEFPDEELGFNYDYEFPYLHNHDYWEFVYAERAIKHISNKKTVDIEPNSIFIVKPTDRHCIVAAKPESNPDKKPTHLNLKITDDKLHFLLSSYDSSIVKKMDQAYFPVLQLDNGEMLFWKRIINDLLWIQDKQIQCLTIKMIINYIVIKNFDSIFATDKQSTLQIPKILQDVAIKLKSPAYFEYTIEQIIADTNYSKMQLSRLFKKFFSMTMHDYFLDAKLSYAKNKLTLTDESILNIAGDIGFSMSHFVNMFRNHMGMSPGEFRKKQALY